MVLLCQYLSTKITKKQILHRGDNKMDMQDVKEYQPVSSFQKSETGEVLPYKIGHDHIFPCIILKNVNNEFKKYKLNVIKGLIRTEGYMLYLKSPKGDIKVGYIDTNGLKVLKDNSVFDDFEIVAYLSPDNIITGDMIYALM